jgi:hypothetical protein
MGRIATVSIITDISPISIIVWGVITVLDRIGGQHLCRDIVLVAKDGR